MEMRNEEKQEQKEEEEEGGRKEKNGARFSLPRGKQPERKQAA